MAEVEQGITAYCHVVAWNFVDEGGHPIIEVDRDMTREELETQVEGRYAFTSRSLLRPVSRVAIDAALAKGEMT